MFQEVIMPFVKGKAFPYTPAGKAAAKKAAKPGEKKPPFGKAKAPPFGKKK